MRIVMWNYGWQLLWLWALLPLAIYWLWRLTYWWRHGIAGTKALPFFGNMWRFAVGKEHYGDTYQRIYNAHTDLQFVGIYRLFDEPAILLRSEAMIKAIMIRDFQHFEDNLLWIDPKRDPIIMCNPFVSRKDTWRKMRSELVPIFTPNKVKMSFPHIYDVCCKLDKFIDEQVSRERFEAKQLCTRYTLDVVASAAFGIDARSFDRKEQRTSLLVLLERLFQPTMGCLVQTIALLHSPRLGDLVGYRYVPSGVQHWLRNVIGQLVSMRTAPANPPATAGANDFIDWLIEAKGRAGKLIDGDTLIGHCSTFLLEGFETSAALMAFALYEIARNPFVQARLYAEIKGELKTHDGQLTYELLAELNYLEATLYETLRLYPAMMALLKRCTKPFVMPAQCSNGEGSATCFTVPTGMTFVIPVKALHYDPTLYPDPERFMPERFSTHAERQRLGCRFLGFGEGPRMCPGMRFGLAQSKAALVTILRKYSVHLADTNSFVISPTTFLTASEHGIWLKLKRRDNQH